MSDLMLLLGSPTIPPGLLVLMWGLTLLFISQIIRSSLKAWIDYRSLQQMYRRTHESDMLRRQHAHNEHIERIRQGLAE